MRRPIPQALLNVRRGAGSLAFTPLRSPAKKSTGASTVPLANAPNISRTLDRAVGYVPTVTENEGGNRERTFDIYSRLLKDRIILIGRPIDDVVANLVVAQLMYLAADDPEKEIQIYVNSPGGSVSSGFAIYDTMQYVQAPISTVCIGRAASFRTGARMAGAKGRRFSLPSFNIHMHQPLIGGRGMAGPGTDPYIHAREIIRIRGVLNELIAKHTGQSLERGERDTDRDYFLTPQETGDYGLNDG